MFVYCNVEINGEKIEDCVIRAITLTMGMPYEKVVNLLYENGLENGCDSLNLECYAKLLTNYFGLPRISINSDCSVDEIAKKFKNNVLLIRCNSHLTCSMFSNIYDIFDCRDYLVSDIFIVR